METHVFFKRHLLQLHSTSIEQHLQSGEQHDNRQSPMLIFPLLAFRLHGKRRCNFRFICFSIVCLCLAELNQLFNARFDISVRAKPTTLKAASPKISSMLAGMAGGGCRVFCAFCASKKPLHDANWLFAQKHMSLTITDSHASLFP
jgi:hypothetical protein